MPLRGKLLAQAAGNSLSHPDIVSWPMATLEICESQVLVASNREAGRALLAGDIWALVGWWVLPRSLCGASALVHTRNALCT